MAPLVAIGLLAASMFITHKAGAKVILDEPKPRVAIPVGWRRAWPTELNASAISLAQDRKNSPGAPGTLVVRDGWGSLTEWHYHDPNGPVKPWGWHRGITILKRL